MQARGLDKPSQLKAVQAAIKVVAFLNCESPNHLLLPSLATQLGSLNTQLSHNLKPLAKEKNIQVLQEAGKLMGGAELTTLVQQAIVKAEEGIAHLSSKRKGILEVAWQVQATLLCALLYGFTPMRQSSLLSLSRLPGSLCVFPDCQHPIKCPGNRVWLDKQGLAHIKVSHHKTSGTQVCWWCVWCSG